MKSVTTHVDIPELISSSNMLTVYNGYDVTLGVSSEMVGMLAIQIKDRELDSLRRGGKDLGKINDMLTSPDFEMRNLGIQMLKDITKYAGRIVEACMSYPWNSGALEGIVNAYVMSNMLDIVGEIK